MNKQRPGDREPTTYFEIEQRKRLNPEPGEDKSDAVPQYPKLPKNNPWASDLVGPEPLIDRTEDQS